MTSSRLPTLARCAALLSAALILGACSEGEPPPKEAAARTELRFASMKDIRDINPHLYGGEMAAQSMVFEALVENAPNGQILPKLAESWEISEDGRVYTFHLRRGVRFTDGEPFNAAAVKLNFEAILENRIRHAWLDLVNKIESNEAVDEYTWRLTLKRPYFPTLVELGVSRPFRFISPRCMKDGHTKAGVSCLAGTGPWMLAEHRRESFARFEANPSYWGAPPKLRSVRWTVLPDAQTILMALEAGEIDLVFGADGDQLTTDALANLAEEKKLVVRQSAPAASRTVLLNSTRPVTGDPAVREAIQHALDRSAIVEGVLNGLEAPAETLFAPNTPYCDVPLTPRRFDPDLAAKILDDAGWKLGDDGVRVKNGQRCEAVFRFNAQNAQERTIAEAIQADLARIGISLRTLGEEKQIYLNRLRDGDFDLAYSLSWGAPYDPQSFFSSWRVPVHGDCAAQRGLAAKPQIDRRVNEFLVEPDEDKRREIAAEILRIVHDSGVYLPISYSRTKAVSVPELQGVEFAVSQYEIPFEKMHF